MTTWSRYTYSTNIQRWYSYTKSCTCTHQLLFKPCGSSFPLFTSCASSSLLFHLRKCLRHFQYKIIEKRFTFKTWNSCVLKKRSNVLGISVRSLKSFDVYGRTVGPVPFFGCKVVSASLPNSLLPNCFAFQCSHALITQRWACLQTISQKLLKFVLLPGFFCSFHSIIRMSQF